MAEPLVADTRSTEGGIMQSYNVYVLGQLSEERRDELARAYRQSQRVSRGGNDAQRKRLRRLLSRVREVNRALAYRA
jgi:hypothetical protein